MSDTLEMPLFPLRTVLFNGGQLPLRIFESRYVDMVSRCLRSDSGFGVVLIRSGGETHASQPAQPDLFEVGTEARIVDFNQLSDGLLGIVAQGGRKFRILRVQAQEDHLLIGQVQYLPEEPNVAVGDEHGPLVDILRDLVKHPLIEKLELDIDYLDARSVGWRLAELLPIEPEIKQSLLQLSWPKERLTELTRLVTKLRS